MLSKYIPKRFANAMLKHVVAVTLFFPYYYSHNDNLYYQDFILVNFFAVLFMIFACTSWKLDFKRNGILVGGMGILLVAYNVFATYMNYNYHHWYGEQINTTIAFLFFMVLLLVKDSHALIDSSTIKATIHMIVASNVLALMFRSIDKYERLFFMNTTVQLREYPTLGDEPFAWLYAHKSQYALIILLCISFFAIYKQYFRNIFTYITSQLLLLIVLYLSDSYTSLIAALLIFIGQFLDYLWNAQWRKKLATIVISSLPLLFFTKELYNFIDKNRTISTLGGRTFIWDLFTELIQQNPNGMNIIFSAVTYHVEYVGYTTNCHNVFLNHMFRYSIPVGGIYSAIFILIVLFAIKRNLTFSAVAICVALYIPMTMDHALSATELPFFIYIMYCMFFHHTLLITNSNNN